MSQFSSGHNDVTQKDLKELFNLMLLLSEDKARKNEKKLKDFAHWQRIMKYSDIATVRDIQKNNKLVGIGILVEHVQGFGYFSIEDVVRSVDYEKCGIGSVIMEKLHEIALKKGIKEITLTSNERRRAAHNLYKKLGYELTSTTCKFKICPNDK